jgi:hypothetical protein
MREYEQVITLNAGWKDILKKYDIKWVIMHSETPLVRELSEKEQWEVAYQDTTAVILVHKRANSNE